MVVGTTAALVMMNKDLGQLAMRASVQALGTAMLTLCRPSPPPHHSKFLQQKVSDLGCVAKST